MTSVTPATGASAGVAAAAPDDASLLRRYCPVLLLFPERAEKRRPGAWWGGEEGRGDYHPCSVELFLSNVTLHNPRRESADDRSGEKGRRLEPLLAAVELAQGVTKGWELDLDGFGRGDASGAWRSYHLALAAHREAHPDYRPTAYGRAVRDKGFIALQYWYLYYYNDAANKHEGDWEMVTVLLRDGAPGAEPVPDRVGFAGHQGGVSRPWNGVSRKGERPLVYVARGSHAAYLHYLSHGHHTGKLAFRKGLAPWLETAYRWSFGTLSRWLFFLGVRDYPPSLEDEGDGKQGDLVEDIDLRIVPVEPPPIETIRESPWWWMHLDCPWGSSRPARHPLGGQFIGPDPPWLQQPKWSDPVCWTLDLRQR